MSVEDVDIKPGDKVGDRYLIKEKIGEGGMGAIFRAIDERNMRREVAIKVLATNYKNTANIVAKLRLSREQEAALRIVHPNVVHVIDSGATENGETYIVQEFIQGEALDKLLKREKRLRFDETVKIVNQIGDALEAAHSEGIVHRDLKPSNIMLQNLSGGGKHVKVIDFGIAKVDESLVDGKITETGMILGTPFYASPEQMQGMQPQPSIDQWGLAAIAYEMLTGELAFKADTVATICIRQIEGPKAPKKIRPDLPKATERVLLKALKFKIEERYQSVREFCQALTDSFSQPEENNDRVSALDATQEADAVALKPPHIASVSATDETVDNITPVNNAELNQARARAIAESILPTVDGAPPAQPMPPARSNASTASTIPVVVPESMRQPQPAKQKDSRLWQIIIGIVAALILLPGIYLLLNRSAQTTAPPANNSSANNVVVAPGKPVSLTYKLYMKNGDADPFYASGRGVYHQGDKFKFIMRPSETMRLYLFNEGTNGELIMLFPAAHLNEGSSLVEKDKEISLPNQWFEFDNKVGEENLLVLMSEKPVDVIESLSKDITKDANKGVVDAAAATKIRDWIKNHDTDIKQRNETSETILNVPHEPLIAHIALQHR